MLFGNSESKKQEVKNDNKAEGAYFQCYSAKKDDNFLRQAKPNNYHQNKQQINSNNIDYDPILLYSTVTDQLKH